jgi:hypothetical protein
VLLGGTSYKLAPAGASDLRQMGDYCMFFLLDQKERKNQEKTKLPAHKANASRRFFGLTHGMLRI